MFLEFTKYIKWVPLVVVGLAVLCATNPIAVAQHGTAEPGLYTFDYHGDTWTGTLSAVDHEKDAITLTYEHKGKTENFSGLFKRPLEVVDQDGKPTHAQTHLQLGDNLTVYYISQGRKYSIAESDGKIPKYVANDNLIFKIMLLPPPKTKH
jgi:hypothetical protein